MIFIGFLFLFLHSIYGQNLYECDFDYGLKCLPNLLSASLILLNETSEEPRQPASDVTAIETSNDQGECFFPFQFGSFEMYFCEQSDPDLPGTCPTINATGPRINCSYGEYGYEKFEIEEIGSRSHKLDLSSNLLSGEHCIRFYYYLSNQYSNGSIKVILQDSESNNNVTIVIASSRLQNRWHQIRQGFSLYNDNPTIYFVFERGSSIDLFPFYIAIDEITIIDVECEPITSNITQLSSTTTQTTISIISSISTSIFSNNTITSPTTSLTSNILTSQMTSSTSMSTTISITESRTSSTGTPIRNSTITTRISTLTTSTTTTTDRSLSIKIRSNVSLIILFLFFIIKFF